MNDEKKESGNSINIGDGFSGQFIKGDNNVQIQNNQSPPPETADSPERLSPEQRRLKKQLFHNLNKYFDEEEIRTLCFELGIKYDDLPGRSLRSKNRELVDYFAGREKLEELRTAGQEARPEINW